MGATILLIRHASVEPLGKMIAGRGSGIHLNDKGRMEAQQIVDRLADTKLDAIYSSPMERAQETAAPLGAERKLKTAVIEEFTEIDFGGWTGKSFTELDELPEWKRFNECRSLARIPGGESMLDVVQRMVRGMEVTREEHPDGAMAVFSHCDPIRAVLGHYAGMSLDAMLRLAVAPASISAVKVDGCAARILALNHVFGHFRIAED